MKSKLKLTKQAWIKIGEKTGWFKTAQTWQINPTTSKITLDSTGNTINVTIELGTHRSTAQLPLTTLFSPEEIGQMFQDGTLTIPGINIPGISAPQIPGINY